MRSLASISFLILVVPACATTSTVGDELAGESASDDAVASDGKADAAVDGAYTYFAVTTADADGGFALARLNRSTTICYDGRAKAACYTQELDWSEASLSTAQQQKLFDAADKAGGQDGVYGIVRGRFAKAQQSSSLPSWGRFVVTEAWVAEGSMPSDGVFARVMDNGIRCIAAPCPTLTEKGLNESRSANIAGVDFSASGLTDREVQGFFDSFATDAGGAIIVGDRYTVRENGRTAKGRTAVNAYHRLADATTPAP